MKKISFLILTVAVFLTTACFESSRVTFSGSLVEFQSTIVSSLAVGKTYPILNVTRGTSIATQVNLVARQSPQDITVRYSVDRAESTAVEGTHYVLTDAGNVVFKSNTSTATTNIETRNVANMDVVLVLILEGNETIKPSENYKRVGFRIR